MCPCHCGSRWGTKSGDEHTQSVKTAFPCHSAANCPFLSKQRLDSLTHRAGAKKGRAPHTNGQGPIPSSNNSRKRRTQNAAPTFTSRRSNFSSSFLGGAQSAAPTMAAMQMQPTQIEFRPLVLRNAEGALNPLAFTLSKRTNGWLYFSTRKHSSAFRGELFRRRKAFACVRGLTRHKRGRIKFKDLRFRRAFSNTNLLLYSFGKRKAEA